MTKPFRTYLPEQDLLLLPSLREWLPEDHLAYFVSDVVDSWICRPSSRCTKRTIGANLRIIRG